MTSRVVVVEGLGDADRRELAEGADLLLAWRGPQRNALLQLAPLVHAVGPLSTEALDLLDVAAAIYLADLALPRGRNEDYVRSMELDLAVRRPEVWRDLASDVARLVHLLTGDNVSLRFHPLSAQDLEPVEAAPGVEADCVSLLSGGIDSLAAAALLLSTERRPLFLTHRSGNPTIARAQRSVVEALGETFGPVEQALVDLRPHTTRASLSFPPAETRDPSRRSRSLFFLALAAAAADALDLREIYLGENGVLTAAVPLAPSRAGALSTRSTHPSVLRSFEGLTSRLGMTLRVLNPFQYQTKAELLRDVLRPNLSARQIQTTVSCWMAGRRHRQCGGCVPCLLRRVSMLAAGLPDEAYEMDLFGRPEDYRGTDAYVNLVDFLAYARQLQSRSEVELLLSSPALLDLHLWDVSVPDIVAMLKRCGAEVGRVMEEYFPGAAHLMASLAWQREGRQ